MMLQTRNRSLHKAALDLPPSCRGYSDRCLEALECPAAPLVLGVPGALGDQELQPIQQVLAIPAHPEALLDQWSLVIPVVPAVPAVPPDRLVPVDPEFRSPVVLSTRLGLGDLGFLAVLVGLKTPPTDRTDTAQPSTISLLYQCRSTYSVHWRFRSIGQKRSRLQSMREKESVSIDLYS